MNMNNTNMNNNNSIPITGNTVEFTNIETTDSWEKFFESPETTSLTQASLNTLIEVIYL